MASTPREIHVFLHTTAHLHIFPLPSPSILSSPQPLQSGCAGSRHLCRLNRASGATADENREVGDGCGRGGRRWAAAKRKSQGVLLRLLSLGKSINNANVCEMQVVFHWILSRKCLLRFYRPYVCIYLEHPGPPFVKGERSARRPLLCCHRDLRAL